MMATSLVPTESVINAQSTKLEEGCDALQNTGYSSISLLFDSEWTNQLGLRLLVWFRMRIKESLVRNQRVTAFSISVCLLMNYESMIQSQSISICVPFHLSMFQTQIPRANCNGIPTPNSLFSPFIGSLRESMMCVLVLCSLFRVSSLKLFSLSLRMFVHGLCINDRVESAFCLLLWYQGICTPNRITIWTGFLIRCHSYSNPDGTFSSLSKNWNSHFLCVPICFKLMFWVCDQNDTLFHSLFWVHSSSSLFLKVRVPLS